jgi:hypothetical protein
LELRLIVLEYQSEKAPQKPTQEILTTRENLREMLKSPFDQLHYGHMSNHLVFFRTQDLLNDVEYILRLFVRLMMKPF